MTVVLLDADRDRCARFAPQEVTPAALGASPGVRRMGESHA